MQMAVQQVKYTLQKCREKQTPPQKHTLSTVPAHMGL